MAFQRRNTRSAKLTSTQVLEIRQRYADGETQASLCRAFGMAIGQIGRIVRGESWAHLPTPKSEHELELEAKESEARFMARLASGEFGPGKPGEPTILAPALPAEPSDPAAERGAELVGKLLHEANKIKNKEKAVEDSITDFIKTEPTKE